MKLGIVSLQRQPPDPMNWVRYHVDVGITYFYIWLEDTDELKPQLEALADQLTAEKGQAVIMYAEIGTKVDRSTENNYFDILDRQQAFVNRMITKAREEDGVDWVFHIDDDELLHPRSKDSWDQVLDEVKPGCASIHLTNWEGYSPAKPKGSWVTDDGVRYMPGECGHLFAAYANGKAATRTAKGQTAWGVHHFQGGKECELPEDKGVLLHHDSLAMGPEDMPPQAFVRKTELRVTSNLKKIPFSFTHESVAAMKAKDMDSLKKIWIKYRSQKGSRFKECKSTVGVQLPSHSW
jgi:hypothetical protein